MARSMRLQGAWTLVVLLLALIVVSNLPSSHAQTSNSTTTNTTSTVASPAKAPAPSPKKAPSPAPKKAPPPPPFYPKDHRRTDAVYGLTFGGIGFCVAVLATVLVHDFVKKVGYFKPRETATTKQLLHDGEFTAEDAQKAIESPPRRYS
eukprot:TRINITY_DN3191_c0_g1_i1.p1 TRINITY_DN3191_c0_g1~~TRINITY_DN3191_c0_g1_i1.p1  ORF type:complete len:149 (-),score=26.23 TRINITY_DN3191_c0_g1_i1:333-779(-)